MFDYSPNQCIKIPCLKVCLFFFAFLSSFNYCIMLYDVHTIFDIIPKNNHLFFSFRVTLFMYLIIPSMHEIFDDYIQAK